MTYPFHAETSIRKTQKAHGCCHCLSDIPSGSPCVKQSGVWDGEFYSEYSHHDCRALWNEVFSTYGDQDRKIGREEGTPQIEYRLRESAELSRIREISFVIPLQKVSDQIHNMEFSYLLLRYICVPYLSTSKSVI